MKKERAKVLVLALGALTMACADAPTGPTRTLVPDGVAQAIIQNVIPFRTGGAYPPGVADGYVVLCKTGDAAGSFTFSVTVNNGTPFNVTRTLSGAGATDCGTGPIYITGVGGNGFPETVVITESAQANWAVTNIDIVQHLGGGIFAAGGYTTPRLDDAFNTTTRVATVYINRDMARTVTFTNDYTAPPPPPGGQGCTPGYWKQDHHFDSWPAGYTPGMSFNVALGLPNPNSLWGTTFTMLNALGANGGGKNALARHAAAAILNAASNGVNYNMTVADVQAAVLAALNNNSLIDAKKNILAGFNELGCPLN